MNASTFLYPFVIFLCVIYRVHIADAYTENYTHFNQVDDGNVVLKRDTPSLSIVNPLDVLRKRLLLEMARRQIKENNRQVERNRAILKNVGKRINQKSFRTMANMMLMPSTIENSIPYTQQQFLYKQQYTHPYFHIMPAVSTFFDYTDNPSLSEYKSTGLTTNYRRFDDNEQRTMAKREYGYDDSVEHTIQMLKDYGGDILPPIVWQMRNDERSDDDNYKYDKSLWRHKRSFDNIKLHNNQKQQEQQQQQQQQTNEKPIKVIERENEGEKVAEVEQKYKIPNNDSHSSSMWWNILALNLTDHRTTRTPFDISFIHSNNNPIESSNEDFYNSMYSSSRQETQQ